MKRSNNKLGFIILVVLVALVLIGGVVFMVQVILGGSSKKPSTKPAETEAVDLLENPTATTRVEIKVRGPVVARENHYDIDITLTSSSRQVKVYRGYGRSDVAKEINLDNDQNSYATYLKALKNRGFSKETTDKVATKDDGICPKGQLIEYIVRDDTTTGSDLWTTSCNDIQGSFGGSSQGVIDLTLAQIPGAKDAIDDVQRQLGGNSY